MLSEYEAFVRESRMNTVKAVTEDRKQDVLSESMNEECRVRVLNRMLRRKNSNERRVVGESGG